MAVVALWMIGYRYINDLRISIVIEQLSVFLSSKEPSTWLLTESLLRMVVMGEESCGLKKVI